MRTQFDKLIDQFEGAWKDGHSPKIEDWLEQVPEVARPELLEELIAVDIFYRIKVGQKVQKEDYRSFGDNAVSRARAIMEASAEPSKTERQAESPSRMVGRYKLLQKIGEGGMGSVWMAQQYEPVSRRVAIKLIKSEFASKEVIARFEVERQALAMMDHHNIAKVFDAGSTDGGTPYFAMELVNGIPITRYCDKNRLSVEDRLKLFVPVCKAVQHAHQKGILHRDLKPSNVLVTHHDGEPVPKVIDFGVAKAQAPSMKLTDKTLFTEFGRVVGTLQYMSPEQAQMSELDVDTRADVYSLGVMLYELLIGSTPVDEKTISSNAFFEVLEIIREKDPPRPSTKLESSSVDAVSKVSVNRQVSVGKLRQALKGDLDWIVMKALEKDRTRRYQTTDDLARDISNYLAGEAVAARPPSTLYQAQKFAVKNRGLVISILTIGIVLLAGIIGTSIGMIHANRKTAEAELNRAEADSEREKARTSEQLALKEKDNAQRNETRAVSAEARARRSEFDAMFQLAHARWEAGRVAEARSLLFQIPPENRDNFEWHVSKRLFQGSELTCYGHTGRVTQVGFSLDGMQVMSAGSDQTLKFWDAASGEEIRSVAGHKAALSPDGFTIASVVDAGSVRMSDARTGQEKHLLSGNKGFARIVVFSRRGQRIATGGDDGNIVIWDVASGEQISSITGHKGPVLCVAFSADGKQVISGGNDKAIRVWDCDSAKHLKDLPSKGRIPENVDLSPDGQRALSTSYSHLYLWDLKTGQKIESNSRSEHRGEIDCATFSPDGGQIATAGRDGIIKVWQSQSLLLVDDLKGHLGPVNDVSWSPDCARLVSGSSDGTVKVWNSHDSREMTLAGEVDPVVAVAFRSDGQQLASGSYRGVVKVWNPLTGKLQHDLRGHSRWVAGVAFSPDGGQLASASYDRTVRLWDTKTGEGIAELVGHTSWVRSVEFSPDGEKIVSASWDGTVKVWSASSHQELLSIDPEGNEKFYDVVFSPDGSLLATASNSRSVKLWDAETGEQFASLNGHTGRIRSVAFGPKGKQLVSVGHDQDIRVWDVETREEVTVARNSFPNLFAVDFAPHGNLIAAAGAEKTVKLWDSETGQEYISLKAEGGIQGVAFSPDGSRLAVADHFDKVRIWDANEQHETVVLTGHTDSIRQVSFSADGDQIFSRSDKEFFAWNFKDWSKGTASLEPKRLEATEPEVSEDQASLDGRWFVTFDANHVVLVDREYKQSADARAYRLAKANFDPHWHFELAKEAAGSGSWFAAVFHFRLLVKNEPTRTAFRDGLIRAFRKLESQSKAAGPELDPHLALEVEELLGGSNQKL